MRIIKHNQGYRDNLPGALEWKKELFTVPKDYNRMIGAIRRNRFEWQYFNGLAFSNPSITKWAYPDIKEEMFSAMSEIETRMVHDRDGLSKQLDKKIRDYETKEITLYNTLVGKLVNYSPITRLSPGMTIRQKVDCWRDLFIGSIVNQLNNSGQAISLNDENDALYCFLMSKEMYEAIKNSPALRTRLSREDWEKGFYSNTKGTSLYSFGEGSKEMKKLEDSFAEFFFRRAGSKSGMGNLNDLIEEAFDNAISGFPLLAQKKGDYVRIIGESFRTMRRRVKKTGITDYSLLHDELKKWGANALTDLNVLIKKDFETMRNIPEITEVKVGTNQVFFTITGQNFDQIIADKKNGTVAGQIVQTIKSLIQDFFNNKVNKEENFELNIIGLGKYLMSPDTALSAAAGWEKVDNNNVYLAIRNYLDKNGRKGMKSNSIISGFLGELAVFFASRFKVQRKLTGSLQQRYRYGQAKNPVPLNRTIGAYSDKAFMGDIEKKRIEPTEGNSLSKKQERWNKNRKKYEESFKGTGQFFSDMQLIEDMEVLTGINIKRYVKNENTFTLTTLQTKGLKLNHANLRRYLTEREIILLNYLQSNYNIMKDFQSIYGEEPIDIGDAARAFMDNRVSSIIRITGAGFDTTNYIIAANGYFIPASAIFQYLKQQIEKENFELFEVKNTSGLPYQTIEYKAGEIKPAHPENKLDVAQLRYMEMTKNANSLTYRFNEFKVQIKQLLQL